METKYIITQTQLERVAKTNVLLAREIQKNTLYQVVKDSAAMVEHLDNVAKQLVADDITTYELPVTGGAFIWRPKKQ